jgi:molybdopterin/thiamine biosynthesis adenylyltransferase
MTLNSNTKIGLTFGQILSLITITGAFVMGYRDLDLRINQLEQKATVTEKQLLQTNADIEVVRIENRQDHSALGAKIDQLLVLSKTDKK